jgi:hypothetical protein
MGEKKTDQTVTFTPDIERYQALMHVTAAG